MIERLKKTLPILKEIEQDFEWIENEFSLENSTEEERSQVAQLRNIFCKPFDETSWRLERMFLPIKNKGHLFLNNAGRYQIEDTDIYFTAGSSCEVFLPYYDDEEKYFTWIYTTIESKNGEYYFTERPKYSMNGALVRTR